MENFILFNNVSFSSINEYDDTKTEILKDINLSVGHGEFISVVGKNGCGKSTLSKHFNAVLVPTGGDILIDGINTKCEEKIFEIRQKIGLVLQNPDNQIISGVVEDDVAFGLENLGINRYTMRENVDKALKSVGMYEYKNSPTYTLSGGQKQRVAIAGVLAMNPECIVLDEPTSMLDPSGRKEVLDTIVNLNKKFGTTIVLITHDMEELSLSGRVLIMDEGSIVSEKTPEELFCNSHLLNRYGLLPPSSIKLLYNLENEGYKVKLKSPDTEICTKEILSLLEEVKCRR
ncbi:MAG: energy-coupling factor transporter ATPase [Oscillospiraceae bacterium]|jgi:energy-coupling factor transport system ATP-binding protein|nr:energy-coupling factor transporter ATPase [Oscillospiraceae bacterium]